MENKVISMIGNLYLNFVGKFEKYLVLFTVLFFIGGIFLASIWDAFGQAINNGANAFIDGYAYLAPIAIFLILAPAVAKMFKSKSGSFGIFAVKWLAVRRFFAAIFAAFFTVIIFGFPLFPQGALSIGDAVLKSLKTVLTMAYTSPFMIAIWVGLIAALLSMKVKWLYKILSSTSDKFEQAGQYFIPFVPLFMLAVGAYIYQLPNTIGGEISTGAFKFSTLNIFGFFSLDPNSISGMIAIYVIGALLVGLACAIWHLSLLFIVKFKNRQFSLKDYFLKYWVRVYPLLWATSSEALSTPLNLYLTKKHFPYVKKVVRRFVVGMGSYLNINGTLICVIVLGGVVTSMIGIRPSLVEWLLAVPIIFILGYGVPGIPGELVLFAGPIALLLGLPPALSAVFIALYVGLQIGLPDSFRTGNNSTDNCLYAVLLNKPYEERFLKPIYDEVEKMVGKEELRKSISEGLLTEKNNIDEIFKTKEFKELLVKELQMIRGDKNVA